MTKENEQKDDAKEPATPKAAPAGKPAPETREPEKREAEKPAPRKEVRPEDLGHPPPPAPWYRTLRADPPVLIRAGLGLGLLGLILILWWLVTRGSATDAIISPVKLPGPGRTLSQLDDLVSRDLDDAIFASLWRVLKGIGLAAFVGIGLGVVAGSLRGVAAAMNPIILFLRSIPMGAIIPLTFLWFGTGETQKWTFIFLAVVPFVFSDTVKAISTVPQRYVETAETLGASQFQIVRKVLVPLALPDIITSLRFQFGLAFGYIVLAETAILTTGIGQLFKVNEIRGLTEHTYLLLFVLAVVAFVIDFTVRYLQRGFFRYRNDL